MLKALRGGALSDCALLLGGFDGFHAGHRTLLNKAFQTGLPVAITAIEGGKAGGDIFTLSEREEIFRREGVSFVEEISFTEEFRNTSAEDFLRGLFGKIPARAVFCGEDFRFGKGALGDTELLKRLSPCPVTVLPLLADGGEKVAAARLKRLLSCGQIGVANALFGYGYFIAGSVRRGREVGRTLGFPTLNLVLAKEKYQIKEGVYAGYVATTYGDYRAIINFGARPTFGVEECAVEAHLIGFDRQIYGEEVRVFPETYLRPVQKFSSREELITQLQKDILTETEHD